MNKTIIININGIVFHIEEDAYEVLKAYMTDVKRHFSSSADSLEITTDIENRIAEMFNEILANQNKQVIVEADVKLVVEQMGSVEDFESAEDDAKPAGSSTVGYNTERRRLFRDPDDHLVSGVAAGIANYFDIPAVWIRLAFALSLIFAGSGLILYVILWIVIPKATSRADRMAMKGEKQDLKGFKKNFEDEMSMVKENLSNFRQEARPFVYKVRDFLGDFFEHLGTFLRGTGSFLVKLIGLAILLASFGLAIALIVVFVGFIAFGKTDIYHIFPFNIVNEDTNLIFLTGGFLLLAIPLLTLILVTIGFLFKNATFNRSIGTTLLCIWLASLGAVVYYGARASADFKQGAKLSKTINIKATPNNTYYLQLNDAKYLTNEDSTRLRIKERFNGMIILDDDYNGDDFDSPDRVRIDIEKSDVPQPVLVQSFTARGRNDEDALTNARNISYRFIQKDSVLKFDRHLERLGRSMWRGQEVHMTLKVPLNAKLVIDGKLDRNLDLNLYNCGQDNTPKNPAGSVYIMATDGLQCKIDTAARAAAAKADSIKNHLLPDTTAKASQQ
ncbi:PspC domain-containing protein [Mucilaginibacter lappiensis]|uniref:Phage shock protein PspC (Stress-responsive transcriptional regulator) n=1 Tax=Mucilaginibacter lappiensis TaxID=354630 RepID=A0A1N7EJ50_9SPHI|nr:PspC domain-containing protein [Mucilaginibacter lappiensis]MBB6111817.1 phage shock protein PspC (stress-responsive transcriptional regulator) [Mucilaginibacter lappiensis]MBB6129282.1 phage shock protein PspC (stress-responsive transcriptional regulator) [Mucilaginibacter lappiensis]SIR88087.1 phage shock protein C (PspC) family protein [Mucilaginibacter lappiensis]